MATKSENLARKTKSELIKIIKTDKSDLVVSLDKANLEIAGLKEDTEELNKALAKLKVSEEKLEAANKALSTSNKNYVNALAKDAEEYSAMVSKKSMWQFLALFFLLCTIVMSVFNILT